VLLLMFLTFTPLDTQEAAETEPYMYCHKLDVHLDAPEEASADVQGAKEQGHQLDKPYPGRVDVQARLQESLVQNCCQ
jgi:hypothetical protein